MMEKTYFRFVCVELMERLARLDGLLAQEMSGVSSDIAQALQNRLRLVQQALLQERELLVSLLTDAAPAAKLTKGKLPAVISSAYQALCQLTQVVVSLDSRQVLPETHLFLKDALPEELTCKAGYYMVVIEPEDQTASVDPLAELQLDQMLMAGLSVLQRYNPLGWLGLAQPLTDAFSRSEASLNVLRKSLADVFTPKETDQLFGHCMALRLFGPAYYFYAAADSSLRNDAFYLNRVEPVLFYGLQHFNFAHNQLVILHEAMERAVSDSDAKGRALSQANLRELFKVVEKVIPDWLAFSEKNFERSFILKERLADGVLLSGSSVFHVDEMGDELRAKEQEPGFAIYDALTMMTEYPHSPREIVNAGWLQKMDRGPVWLFAALQDEEPFACLYQLVSRQDHLLTKSIETSEVHRVLLCGN